MINPDATYGASADPKDRGKSMAYVAHQIERGLTRVQPMTRAMQTYLMVAYDSLDGKRQRFAPGKSPAKRQVVRNVLITLPKRPIWRTMHDNKVKEHAKAIDRKFNKELKRLGNEAKRRARAKI